MSSPSTSALALNPQSSGIILSRTVDESASTPQPQARTWYTTYKKAGHGWTYLGRSISIVKHSLDATRNPKYHSVVTKLKLFRGISLLFIVESIYKEAKAIFDNIRSDKSTAAFSLMNLVVVLADFIDIGASVVNASLATASKLPVAFLSAIGMPLGFIMTTLGTVSKSIQIHKTRTVYNQIHGIVEDSKRETPQQIREKLQSFLNQHLTATDQERKGLQEEAIKNIEKSKRNLLSRGAPEEVITALKAILEKMEDPNAFTTQEQINEVVKQLELIMKHLNHKTYNDIGSIVANVLIFIALCMFASGAVHVTIPLLFLTSSFVVRLTMALYSDVAGPARIPREPKPVVG